MTFKKLFTTHNEGINKPLISLKYIQKDILEYKKFKGKTVKTKDIIKMINKIGSAHIEALDLEFELDVIKVNDLKGTFVISGAYDEDTITINFMYTDNEILISDLLWDYLYNDFPGFIKHEVLHYQQMTRREDKETFRELEGGRTNLKDYINGNLAHKDEIEAYAMNASDEVYKKFGGSSLKIIQKNLTKAVKVSNAMSDYYKLVGQDKKLWHKFINKVIKYLELKG